MTRGESAPPSVPPAPPVYPSSTCRWDRQNHKKHCVTAPEVGAGNGWRAAELLRFHRGTEPLGAPSLRRGCGLPFVARQGGADGSTPRRLRRSLLLGPSFPADTSGVPICHQNCVAMRGKPACRRCASRTRPCSANTASGASPTTAKGATPSSGGTRSGSGRTGHDRPGCRYPRKRLRIVADTAPFGSAARVADTGGSGCG